LTSSVNCLAFAFAAPSDTPDFFGWPFFCFRTFSSHRLAIQIFVSIFYPNHSLCIKGIISSSLTSFGFVPAIPFSSTPVIISISSLSSSTFSNPRLLTAWTFGPVFFFLNENDIP